MQFNLLTLFPEQVRHLLDYSILKRAQEANLITIKTHDLRQFGLGDHQQVDDTPYGGGRGMVLKPDVVVPAIQKISAESKKPYVILMTPQGQRFTQAKAEELAKHKNLLLVAGHYEGFDERIRNYVDEEISIGDFVLTGGELPAAVIVDAVARLVPGVLTDESAAEESHVLKDEDGNRLLEYPQYTKPVEFEGKKVPEVLLSGNHAKIAAWRLAEAKKRTNK